MVFHTLKRLAMFKDYARLRCQLLPHIYFVAQGQDRAQAAVRAAAHLRQQQGGEEDAIVAPCRGEFAALVAAVADIHDNTSFLKPVADKGRDLLLVFDDQHFHAPFVARGGPGVQSLRITKL